MTADRLERCRAELAGRGLVGAIVTPGVNFEYLTDVPLERTERLVCLGLPTDGEPWVVCPAFEAGRLSAGLPGATLVPWREEEDPFRLAADRVRADGDGAWAIEPSTAHHDAARLANAARGVRFVDGADVFEALRRRKSPDEVAALRRAIDDAWAVHDEIVPRLAAGATEAEVADEIRRRFAERGREAWSLVQFGPGSAVPHGEPGPRALAPGTVVLLDWGGWGEGFTADLTRAFWWEGEPVPLEDAPDEFRRVAETVRSAQAAALEAAGPGAPCAEVDHAARAVVEAAGFGSFFPHRSGHGLGREIHEAPYLVAGSADRLRPGDVVTIEPGIYLPGRFGVRHEDDVLIAEEGVDVLSRRSAS